VRYYGDSKGEHDVWVSVEDATSVEEKINKFRPPQGGWERRGGGRKRKSVEANTAGQLRDMTWVYDSSEEEDGSCLVVGPQGLYGDCAGRYVYVYVYIYIHI